MEQPEEGYIHIKNAEANNLKGIDVDIPRNRLTVITGVSGSGKTSLAFDTLFAEGQRRFAESLSSFARQFLGRMSKPPVESISGIPPAIAIEQRDDYLRVLFAKIGRTYSPVTGEEVRCDTVASVMELLHTLAASLPAGAPSDEEYSPGICFILADIHWEEASSRTYTGRRRPAASRGCSISRRRDSPACTFCPRGTMPDGWRRSTRSWPT